MAYAGRLLRTGEGTVQPTGEVLSRVVDTFSRTAEGVFELEVELPDGSLTWLSATAEHPFYAVASGKYVSVRHLEVGSRLHVEGGGDALLVSKTWRQGGVEVFNVEVAGEHNFFAAGVLTHNSKDRPCGSPSGRSCKGARWKQILHDAKAPRFIRGWIRQELNRGGGIRNPPGYELAHHRGREAAKGYSYMYSEAQLECLHSSQHRHDWWGQRNSDRPLDFWPHVD